MRKHVEESVATGAAAGRGRGGRFSAGRKREVVMRLLRGEDLESVSRAVGITAARASHGRAQFLAAGQAGLKSRAPDARDEDHRRLQAKIGELLMETELLYAKVDQLEASGPLQPVVKISKRARLDRSPESIIICTLVRMSMGTRRTRRRQEALWVATTDLPQTVAHPFYRRVNALLDAHGFDAFVERQCQRFYAATRGRPSLTPGIYFRALLVGYFEGIDSERGIAWRAADSLAIRRFLGIAVDEAVPDHSTISRTRRLIDVETHRTVFTWVQQRLVASGVIKGATIGIDATTLEANAAMRSIVRRDTGGDYQAYLTGLAQASGIATPTRDDLARLDKKRKKTTSNKDWRSPVDPDAKVAKMKDGRTHLAHKVEHAVDLDTGAIVAVTVQGADLGDTTTIGDTTIAAADQLEEAHAEVDDPQAFTALVADKGYHSNEVMVDLQAVGIRVVCRRAGSGPPRLVEGAGGPSARLCEIVGASGGPAASA